MKRTLLPLLLAISVTGHAGNEKGNGGFLYSKTSKKLLDVAQVSLQNELSAVLKNGRTSFSSASCISEINLNTMQTLVTQIDSDYTSSTIGQNPDGQEESRYFQLVGEKVTATKEYFTSFVDTFFRYQEESDAKKKENMISPIRKGIIHEALHLFGYNEQAADLCSAEILQNLEMSNADKVNRNAAEVMAENEEAVIQYTCNIFKILGLESIILPSRFSDIARSQIAHRIYISLITYDKNRATWESGKERPVSKFIADVGGKLNESKNSCEDVGIYANKVFKFSFEKTIPTLMK